MKAYKDVFVIYRRLLGSVATLAPSHSGKDLYASKLISPNYKTSHIPKLSFSQFNNEDTHYIFITADI